MASSYIETLSVEAEKDLKIDRSALDYESLRTPKLHNRWLKKLYERKDKIFALELKKKVLLKEKWLYYTGKASNETYVENGAFHLKLMKQDIPLFIEADKEIQEIDTRIHIVKQEIEFIQKTIEEINRRSFNITNALKALAFLNGQNI